MQSILLTFADGDTIHTRINGTREEVVDHYALNNRLTADYDAQVKTVRFSDEDIHTFPISENKRRRPGEELESFN